jgi:integrase
MPAYRTPPHRLLRHSLGHALEALLRHTRTRVADGSRSAGTLAMQAGHAPWLLAQLGDVAIADIDEAALDALAARARESGGRGGRPLKVRTVAKRFSTLRRALRLAHRRGELARMPLSPEFAMPPIAPRENIFRDIGEYQAVRRFLPPHRQDWLDVALWTGQHAGDIERMVWSDVAEDFSWVMIRNTKNRKPHGFRVKSPAPLVRALRDMWDRTARRGRVPLASEPIVRPWPTRAYQLGRACVRAGRAPMNATDLRHTCFSWMVSKTGLTPGAQRWGGWSSYRMMEATYVHALPPSLADASDALSLASGEEFDAPEYRTGQKRKSPHRTQAGSSGDVSADPAVKGGGRTG